MKGKKPLDRPVIGLFDVVWKKTGGQLVLTLVVGHTLAANPFAGTRIVGTITTFLVNLDLAFHDYFPMHFKKRVGAIGFEPTASRSRTERTTRLCYAPINSVEIPNKDQNCTDKPLTLNENQYAPMKLILKIHRR